MAGELEDLTKALESIIGGWGTGGLMDPAHKRSIVVLVNDWADERGVERPVLYLHPGGVFACASSATAWDCAAQLGCSVQDLERLP